MRLVGCSVTVSLCGSSQRSGITHMSDAVHGLNLVVEAADGRREALPVGDDELVAQGPRHQHDVVVDEAAKRHCTDIG